MAFAVNIWSPVIITVLIPAIFASATAFIVSSLGGSIIAIKPRKIISFSLFSDNFSSVTLYANAKTRSPLLANSSFALYISPLFFSSDIPSFVLIYLHLPRRISGAPFVNNTVSPDNLHCTLIIFLSDENGISSIFSTVSLTTFSSTLTSPSIFLNISSNAYSVGSPIFLSSVITELLDKIASYNKYLCNLLSNSISLGSITLPSI